MGVSDGGRVDVSACSLDISAQEPSTRNGVVENTETPTMGVIFLLSAWISTVHLHCHPYKSHGGQADQAGPFAVKLLETLALLPSLLHLYMTLTNLCSSARPRQKVPQFKKNPRMMRCN